MSTVVHAQVSNNPLNQVRTEDDWSLPAWVIKSDNAGLYDVPSVPDAYSVLLTWRMLNPADSVYDWTLLDTVMTLNVPVFIRIWASDTMHCPLWLRAKHPNIPIMHNDGGTNTATYYDLFGISPSNFYAMWDTNFTAEFKRFLLAFKARNYLANPNVKFMYVPGGWRYNEWNLGEMVDEINANAPISPANFIVWFQQHLDDYADASNGYPHKMMFTGFGKIENPALYGTNANWFFAANDTAQGNNILTSYAVSIGMSVREGAQEYFNTSSDMFAWGAPSEAINNISYQYINESHPLHSDSLRRIGTENEGFCDPLMLQGGVCSYYHIKMSTLKALQLRVNWLNSRDNLVAYDTSLFAYARKTMNKNVHNSPDVWVALRQVHDPFFSAIPPNPVYNSPLWVHRVTLPFRNWEKWLYQREVAPDGMVVPVYQLSSSTVFDYYNFYAFEALRTDRVNGSDYIYFDVDSGFISGGVNDVQLKITYLDNFSGTWWVEYDDSGVQPYKPSQPIVNQNDNSWKTVTLSFPDAGFFGRQNGGMDFRIYNGGNSDIQVRFVRLVKNNDPLSVSSTEAGFGPLNLVPNPAASQVRIQTEKEIEQIEVFDLLGNVVLSVRTGAHELNIEGLAQGMYFVSVRFRNEPHVHTCKLLKE
ncbi:MAG: T9SS type A sorting domain-containing protein [Bacteroidetes bacterium]|nr:T9SS type A sorting domain-containing protein [Bacteroidota bacterium]